MTNLPAGSAQGIIVSNGELEDFSFEMSGQQALNLLKSEALQKAVEKHNVPMLAEGRVGAIEGADGTPGSYVKTLREADAIGAVMGGGLVVEGKSFTEAIKTFEPRAYCERFVLVGALWFRSMKIYHNYTSPYLP